MLGRIMDDKIYLLQRVKTVVMLRSKFGIGLIPPITAAGISRLILMFNIEFLRKCI